MLWYSLLLFIVNRSKFKISTSVALRYDCETFGSVPFSVGGLINKKDQINHSLYVKGGLQRMLHLLLNYSSSTPSNLPLYIVNKGNQIGIDG